MSMNVGRMLREGPPAEVHCMEVSTDEKRPEQLVQPPQADGSNEWWQVSQARKILKFRVIMLWPFLFHEVADSPQPLPEWREDGSFANASLL